MSRRRGSTSFRRTSSRRSTRSRACASRRSSARRRAGSTAERVHAVLVLEPGTDVDEVVRGANLQLGDHQKIRAAAVWPEQRAAAHRRHAQAEAARAASSGSRGERRPAARRGVGSRARIGRLGPRALRAGPHADAGDDDRRARPELARTRRADDGARGGLPGHRRRGALQRRHDRRRPRRADQPLEAARRRRRSRATEPIDFPSWNRSLPARALRRASLPTWILPLGRIFASVEVRGLEHLERLQGPVIFAANHQSHFDTPVILDALPAALALPRGAGDGEGVLQGALLSRSSSAGRRTSRTARTTTSRRSSSTPSRCRSARAARARRCATSAS